MRPTSALTLIDRLLERREFSELWALKFTELFRAGTREAGNKGARIVYEYIRTPSSRTSPTTNSSPNSSSARGPLPVLQAGPDVFYNVSFDSNAPDHATNISQIFLGSGIECAKCHNHPWEKWTQDDFYGFAAFFARVEIKEVHENDENATVHGRRRRDPSQNQEGGDPEVSWTAPNAKDEQDKDIREALVVG